MLQIPRCRSQQNHRRFMTSTSNLFTRIDNFSTSRDIKTSKANRGARAFPHLTKKESLDNTKENMNYASFLSKVNSATKIDEKSNASRYLLALRKEYDKMVKNIKGKQIQINTMNRDIQFMRDKSKGHTFIFSDIKERVETKQYELQQMVVRQDTVKMETKMLEHIIHRMKSDQLVNKLASKKKEMQAKDKMKDIKAYEEEILQWDEAIHKTVEKANQIKSQFVKNMEQRLTKLHDFESRVQEIQEHQKFQMQRKQRTYELLSMESNDIMDAKNVVLRDVLMANKLLDKLLQGKTNDLLNSYEKVQNCYYVIRNQTNISDPQTMTKKFFSYNQTLQELTSTITYYEQRQEELMKKNSMLKQLQRQKINRMLEDEKIMNNKNKQIQNFKEELAKETFQKEFAITQLSSWYNKYLKSFGLAQSNNPVQNLENLCKYMLEEVEKLNGKSIVDKKFESSGVRFKKIVKEISMQEQKIRRSQAQQVNENNIKENKYLALERSKVKNHFLIKTQVPRPKNT